MLLLNGVELADVLRVATEAEKQDGNNRTMGRKFTISCGLHFAQGSARGLYVFERIQPN